MKQSSTSQLWLIGCGAMAKSYAEVLKAQDIEFIVIGRGDRSALEFEQATGITVLRGGIDEALSTLSAPEQAIVAVSVEELAYVTHRLIKMGCSRILLEKPGALKLAELDQLEAIANQSSAEVWIAYNRRFYSSVQKLHQRVIDDGGITSACFEFTEWSHKIDVSQVSQESLNRWLIANSSHVIDLAFFLIGLPDDGKWHALHSGTLEWHPTAARFHGAGLSVLGIPFAYHSDWQAPGRWNLEICTRRFRYLLQPLESLWAIPLGSIEPHCIPLDDMLDKKFKPGLYRQCSAFISHDTDALCSLSDQRKSLSVYSRIAGYQQ